MDQLIQRTSQGVAHQPINLRVSQEVRSVLAYKQAQEQAQMQAPSRPITLSAQTGSNRNRLTVSGGMLLPPHDFLRTAVIEKSPVEPVFAAVALPPPNFVAQQQTQQPFLAYEVAISVPGTGDSYLPVGEQKSEPAPEHQLSENSQQTVSQPTQPLEPVALKVDILAEDANILEPEPPLEEAPSPPVEQPVSKRPIKKATSRQLS